MSKDINEIVAARYKYLSRDCAKIAAGMGLTYQAVYFILNGKNSFTLRSFIKFCRAAGLNPVKELKEIIAQMEDINDKCK